MKTLDQPDVESEIRGRLARVTPASTRRWGRMTAHQMVCHLTDAFRILLERKTTSTRSTWFSRTVVKWIALRSPLPWPPGILTTPELDQGIGGTPPGEFAADLAELEATMADVLAARASLARWPHPIFGAMTNDDWLRWGYLHMDHHLRQFGA